MTVFVATLALLGLVICLLFAWFWQMIERRRVARQWVERERLLDRHVRAASVKPVAARVVVRPPTARDIRRRRGRPRGRRSTPRLTHSGRWRS